MIYDISLTISENMIIYPNNPGTKIKPVNKIPEKSSNLSEIILGSHCGTHADSMKHISNNGKSADKLPLESFYGKSKVLDLTACSMSITFRDLKKYTIQKGDIILLKTKNSLRGFKKFYKDFIYLSEDGAEYLAEKEIKTLGVDYLAVQKFHAGNQRVHQKILSNMTLFEGLDLSKVPAGNYIFAGLPLKIKNSDGAPARAILISEDHPF